MHVNNSSVPSTAQGTPEALAVPTITTLSAVPVRASSTCELCSSSTSSHSYLQQAASRAVHSLMGTATGPSPAAATREWLSSAACEGARRRQCYCKCVVAKLACVWRRHGHKPPDVSCSSWTYCWTACGTNNTSAWDHSTKGGYCDKSCTPHAGHAQCLLPTF